MMDSLTFQIVPESYGNVVATPLIVANELISKIERWFQNCKFTHLAARNLRNEAYDEPLQVEFTYSRRTLPQRSFDELKNSVVTEIDLLNYHQLVKIIHEFIEKLYKLYIALTEIKVEINIVSFEKRINELSVKFNKKNFPTKISILRDKLNLQPTSLYHLEHINRVRNCLEHRFGIVGEKDCDEGKSYISIHWRYPKVVSSEGDLSPISNIKGLIDSDFIITDEPKEYYKGNKVIFDFYDNYKNIYTVITCFKEIIDSFYKTFNVEQPEDKPSIIRVL